MTRDLEHPTSATPKSDPLWDDGDLVLSRLPPASGAARWLATLAPNAPAAAALRLEHEYTLRPHLDASWAAIPLALEERDGRKRLVVHDPGGELLAQRLPALARADLRERLAIALGAASAVRRLHERDLIHKDLRPATLVVQADGRVWLRGFGHATRLPRERQVASGLAPVAGRLEYMSPEQTGRMNRSIDSRSDLYSLGVTLYELFGGRLPFSAREPLEWVHSHVARQALPLCELSSAIPAPLSAIVSKLLAKMPEDRYQTAAGLEEDLRRCQQQLLASGSIQAFPLGARDVSRRLRIPEQLYGRSREVAQLAAALERVKTEGHAELVLISGYSGVGKSSLVHELHKAMIATRGLFAAGKVDQFKRDIPYWPLAQALRELVRVILALGDAEIAGYRSALRDALGRHGQLIVDLIPELEHVVGRQPPVPELPAEEARRRFQQLFLRFLGVFATSEHPLTLFFDDLQWLDSASLALLEAVVLGETRHLLLIGAYRDNEVKSGHPLLGSLATLRSSGKRLLELVLAPLAEGAVTQLVADALRVLPERAASLAQLIHEKTAGNPFFVIQLLTNLADENLLTFEQSELRWHWELERIRAKASTENVVELMVGKLDRLPATTQRVLQHLACLGRRADTARLSAACGLPLEEVHSALWRVVHSGLVVPSEHGYAFAHDRVQEACEALVPEDARGAIHLRLARLIAAVGGAASTHERDDELFEIVHQFNHAAPLIDSAEERTYVAELNLRAGLRAKSAMAHAAARLYLARGRALLGDDAWRAHYSLCLALELEHAECTFLTGDPTAAIAQLTVLAARAASVRDRAAVARLQIIIYSALDQNLTAVEVCLAYLREVGIDWTPHPSRELVQQEYEQIRAQLAGRTIEELIDLPAMEDPERRATLATLTAVLPVAIFVDENLNSLALCRMVNLSLAYGNSDGSCFAYVMLGRVLGPYFGDPQAGFRFGRLAFDLLERPGMSTYRARVSSVFGSLIHPWTQHVATSIPLARRAFDIAQETGDLTFAAYTYPCLISILLATGTPLSEVESEALTALEFVTAAKFGQIVDLVAAQLQLIRALRGSTPELASFDDAAFDEREFERHLEGNPSLVMAACWYWVRKLQARFLAGDIESALVSADRAAALLWTSGSFLETAEYHYYAALALTAAHDTAKSALPSDWAERLRAHRAQLDTWAAHCPSNFETRASLVAAESARLEGEELAAMRLYERAIASARDAGLVPNEAVAHEVAARFYAARQLETSARAHLAAARSGYQRWGATGKQRRLDRLHPGLGHSTGSVEPLPRAEAEQLDLATVVRTSQAVSHQVGHARIVRSLMEVVVEQAGAQRGVLLLGSGRAMRVEAEATTREGVEVELAPDAPALPDSVLRYVIRTHETVLLDDALTPHHFSVDGYFAQRGVRSVLCLPIQKQADLIGVLYLENNLTPYVFTRTRVEVLKLLAAQAAISFENASLEEKEALLKEVHHRVKNNLQLISSLLSLQAARIADPKVAELFADCRNRVRSMAFVHENLYQAGNFSHIPMTDHIQTLCGHLSRAYGAADRQIEIHAAIGDIHLEMNHAVTCGLIINELVSNALKHAFPSQRPGRVNIELRSLPAGRYTLVVSDDGIGVPAGLELEHADTLGLQLVRDLAAQLNGSAQMQLHRDRGTTFSIEFTAKGRDERSRGQLVVR